MVIPAGSNLVCMNLRTKTERGTPYCKLIEINTASESITPPRVEPCFDI